MAGLGVGLGAGVGLGGAMGSQFSQGMFQQPTKSCVKCGSIIPAANTFCPNCGASQAVLKCASNPASDAGVRQVRYRVRFKRKILP